MFDFIKRLFARPAPAPASPAKPVEAAPLPAPSGEVVLLPLADIPLPPGLAAGSLTGAYALPVEVALAQLPTGRVQVTFGEIRRAAPAGVFPDTAAFDNTPVALPLPRILASVNPALLGRRSQQKQTAIADEEWAGFGGQPVAPIAPASAPPPAFAPPSAPAATDGLGVRLAAVCESWPDAIRQEITRNNLAGANLALPWGRVEAGMKTGRVQLKWGEVGGVGSETSPHRDLVVELPLKIIAPLFLARNKTAAPQKEISIGANVPNLFAAMGQPLAPVAPMATAPVPVPSALPPADLDWSPSAVAQRVNTMAGVGGCVVALSDGLLVAGHLPLPLKSETLAAFLPQIFGRLASYATEVQLGPISSVTLHAGAVPCVIFKTGSLYLTVLGRAGVALPDAVLRELAAELARRNP